VYLLIRLRQIIIHDNIKVKAKLSLCFFLTEHDAMKAYWGVKV